MNSATPAQPTFQIGMVIFPGMTNLDFAGPYEALARMPNTVVTVVAASRDVVRTDIGGSVLADATFIECPDIDMIFIGGGPGINALLEDEVVIRFIRERGSEAKWITSVCTGALALGAAGLLRGYRAATHWTAMEALRPFGAIPTNERVVIDRNRITGGGVTAGIDFALTVAKLLHGDDVAQSIQLGMEYNPAPPFDAGSPDTAPPQIVDAVRSRAAPMTQERIRLANKIATRHGWV